MADDLQERVMMERVELIARLTTEGVCRERDREIALNLITEIAITEIAANNTLSDNHFSVAFSAVSFES